MRGELFQGLKQWEFEREGVTFKLPVFYRDNASLTAIYTASTKRAKALLPHSAMTPVEMSPGRCLVSFTGFEYRDTDIGPYNEFSIAFLITFGKPQVPALTTLWQMTRRAIPVYVWRLPVTTETARLGGVELYGYPKFLAAIDFARGNDWVECRLSEQGEEILTLKGKVLPTAKGKLTRLLNYCVIDGIPITANFIVDPLEFAQTRDSQAAVLRLGDNHPLARTLHEVELSRNPVMYQYSPVMEAVLFGGRNLLDT